jgi:hypothetical protein
MICYLGAPHYFVCRALTGRASWNIEDVRFPPGATEALNKYLEYAPFGEHAMTVREMVDQLTKEIPTPFL